MNQAKIKLLITILLVCIFQAVTTVFLYSKRVVDKIDNSDFTTFHLPSIIAFVLYFFLFKNFKVYRNNKYLIVRIFLTALICMIISTYITMLVALNIYGS